MKRRTCLRLVAVVAPLTMGFAAQPARAMRQYDPGKRRFMQRDPLETMASRSSSSVDLLNLYAYVNSNPTTDMDPSGLARYTPGRTAPSYNPWCGSVICDCSPFGVSSVVVNVVNTPLPDVPGVGPIGGTISWTCGAIWVNSNYYSSCCDVFRRGQSTLKHECVHICQCRREGWLWFWIQQWGQVASLPYAARPFEIEANNLQRDWSFQWTAVPDCKYQ